MILTQTHTIKKTFLRKTNKKQCITAVVYSTYFVERVGIHPRGQ
jgi:hypothetical protein